MCSQRGFRSMHWRWLLILLFLILIKHGPRCILEYRVTHLRVSILEDRIVQVTAAYFVFMFNRTIPWPKAWSMHHAIKENITKGTKKNNTQCSKNWKKCAKNSWNHFSHKKWEKIVQYNIQSLFRNKRFIAWWNI